MRFQKVYELTNQQILLGILVPHHSAVKPLQHFPINPHQYTELIILLVETRHKLVKHNRYRLVILDLPVKIILGSFERILRIRHLGLIIKDFLGDIFPKLAIQVVFESNIDGIEDFVHWFGVVLGD